MKIILLILLSTCALLVNSEYPRFKRRGLAGPPPPPRPPQPPQYVKKWQKPPQFPPRPQNVRGRPPMSPQKLQTFKIPPITKPHQLPNHHQHMKHAQMHKLQQQHHQQLLQQHSQKRPVALAPPAKTFWQKPLENNIQFPKEMVGLNLAHFKQEKAPFQSSPTIPVAIDYDYHVQTNSIPTHTNPIKQIGEKGPIHTIPAPNLSIVDKPNNADLRKHKYQDIRRPHPHYTSVDSTVHQYQVTEPNEQIPQQTFRQTFNQNQLFYTHQDDQNVNHQTLAVSPDQIPQENLKNYQYQPQNDPQTQAILSTYLQQQPQVQFVQNEPNFEQQYRSNQQPAVDKSINVQPDYQSFNYDEQAQQQRTKSVGNSGFVTATYSLGASNDDQDEHLVSGINQDPLTQTQIVQNYFNTGPKTTDGNGGPDAKPSASGNNEERLLASYYSSLPNQEAAERLAQLQAAGKLNSNLMKITHQNGENSIDIYVPDENQNNDGGETSRKGTSDSKEETVDYEDYIQDEEEIQSQEQETGFGSKL